MKNDIVKNILYKNKFLYMWTILLTILISILGLMTPIIIGYVTDGLLSNQSYDMPIWLANYINLIGGEKTAYENLWLIGLLMIIIAIGIGVFSYKKSKLVGYISENIAKDLRDDLYEYLIKMPYSYYKEIQTGDIIQRCTTDVDNIRMFFSGQIINFIRIISLIVIAIYLMLNIDVKLTIISTVMFPFIFLYSILFRGRLNKAFTNMEEAEGELTTVIQENISGIRVVKAFNNQNIEIEKFDNHNKNMGNSMRQLLLEHAKFWATSDFLVISQLAIVTIAGLYYGYLGEITVGEFIIFTSYARLLIWPVRELGRIVVDMTKTTVSLRRLGEIFKKELEKDLDTGDTPSLDGDIVFENVGFEFDDGDNDVVLKNINLTIKKGESVGILGSTGCGKSTLVHLLVRLHDNYEGSIKINGFELNKINKKYLRQNFSIVLQDNFLYAKTIADNIKIANKTALDKDVERVTKISNMHQTIEEFEKGYDTLVGEKGVTLSGGQKQRMTIARTLIKDSKVLIFDDSLSAVDVDTDAKIRQRLKEVNKGITTIIIAQRINTLMECDKIVVMDNGEIKNIGSHNELINAEGLYKEIWKIQNMNT